MGVRTLVLGGYGAVGAPLVALLGARSAGRDGARADVAVDLTEPGLTGYRAAVRGADVVVNASGREDPALAAVAGAEGAAFVDVTATSSYVEELGRLDVAGPVLLSVGLAPGLTTLLGAAVATGGEPIDIGVVLGTGDGHGVAATSWTYGLVGRRFADPGTGAPVRNLAPGAVFDLPTGRRRLLRADFADQHVLSADLGVPVRAHLALTSRVATAALAAAGRLPGLARVPAVHLPGSTAWVAVARAGGRTLWRTGRDQSRGTATIAALAARHAADLPAGVHHLHRVTDLAAADDALTR